MAVTAVEVIHIVKYLSIEAVLRQTNLCYIEFPITVQNAFYSLLLNHASWLVMEPKVCFGARARSRFTHFTHAHRNALAIRVTARSCLLYFISNFRFIILRKYYASIISMWQRKVQGQSIRCTGILSKVQTKQYTAQRQWVCRWRTAWA